MVRTVHLSVHNIDGSTGIKGEASMEKARIVLYDDLVIIDETETNFTDAKNLESIVISCLRTTPGA